MKNLKRISNSNKGFFTLVLTLFFLTAGFSKTFAADFSNKAKDKTEQKSTSKHSLSLLADDDSVNYTDQLKDTPGDDAEFVFFSGNFMPFFHAPRHRLRALQECPAIAGSYNIPLYDLFCNWKFHLA